MYKVFVNEHLINLGSKDDFLDPDRSIFQLNEPSNEEIELLVSWLLKEKISQQVYLKSEDEDSLLNSFESCFTFIEAAGGLVKNTQGETLLIYRLDKWDLPKGKLEKGELPRDAAIREVEEECNVDQLKIISELPSTYHIYVQKDTIYLKRTYWYQMESNSSNPLVPQTEEGIEKVVWADQITRIKASENTYASLKELLIL